MKLAGSLLHKTCWVFVGCLIQECMLYMYNTLHICLV